VENVLALEGQVGLKLEYDGASFETANASGRRYVVDDASVGGTNIFGSQCFASEDLTRGMERRVGLRPLLMGPSLTERSRDDPTARSLDAHLAGVQALLPRVYGKTDACRQAVEEFQELQKDLQAKGGVCCKRAALLYAVSREKEVGDWFVKQEKRVSREGVTFAEDMRERVLPFLMPLFVRNSCQTPNSMVMFSLVLHELWGGERLGNWPLGAAAHHDGAGIELHEGADGKGGGAAA